MASVYENAVRVISKPPEERKVDEIRPLIFWFRKKSDIFRELTPDVVQDIVRNCEFITFKRDDIIIKQGETGDRFYIMLRGVVSIHIHTDLSAEEDEENKTPSQPQVLLKESGELDRSKFGNYIAKLEAGYSFGELALINKNCIRNASIIADETSDVLVVNRELYNRSLKAAQTLELEQRNEFVRSHALFSNWSFRHRKQMSYSLKKEKIQFNEYIMKQGHPVDVLFFLLRGQAKLVMEPSLHESQFPQFYPLQDPEDIMIQEAMSSNDGMPVRQIRKEVSAESLPENQITFPPSALRKKEKPKKLVEVSVVAGSEILGDIEFVLELKTFLQSVICSQECEVYSLDMKNYERLVAKRNPKTADLLRQIAQVKLSSRLDRLHDNQVPLMRTLLFKIDRLEREKMKWKFQPTSSQSSSTDDIFGSSRNNKSVNSSSSGGGFNTYRGPRTPIGGAMLKRSQTQVEHGYQHFHRDGTSHAFSFGLLSNIRKANTHLGEQQELTRDQTDSVFLTRKVLTPRGRRRKQRQKSDLNDWTTNDRLLSVLEERIKGWHTAVLEDKQQKPGRKETLGAVRMRRWNPDGKIIFPPTKVVIKKKVRYAENPVENPPHYDVTDSPVKNKPTKRCTNSTLHSRGLSEAQAQHGEKREDNERLHRDLLTTKSELTTHCKSPSFFLTSGQQQQEPSTLYQHHSNNTYNTMAMLTVGTTGSHHHHHYLDDEETGTILDVLKRRHDHTQAQIQAMSELSYRKQRRLRRNNDTHRFNQFLSRSYSFTIPLDRKIHPLPDIVGGDDQRTAPRRPFSSTDS